MGTIFDHTSRAGDAAVRLLDLAALVLVLPVTYELYVHFVHPDAFWMPGLDQYWLPLIVLLLVWVASAWMYQVYELGPGTIATELARMSRALAATALAAGALTFLFREHEAIPRLLAVGYFGLAYLVLSANRIVLRAVARAAGTTSGKNPLLRGGRVGRPRRRDRRDHPRPPGVGHEARGLRARASG